MSHMIPRRAGRVVAGLLVAATWGMSSFGRAQTIGSFDTLPVVPADEALLFTPEGFTSEGHPAQALGDQTGQLQVMVRGPNGPQPTLCRVNLVGADGQYYYPAADRFYPYRLTGAWPEGLGNRQSKAPIRYWGRYFYSPGEFTATVPAGKVRIEVAKGLEFTPVVVERQLVAGHTERVDVQLQRTVDMAALGYYSGDAHLHFRRAHDEDDQLILDLLEAEDVRYGNILCYNDDTTSYVGQMAEQASPQYRGLGLDSARARGDFHIISGQEYRSSHYGHMNLFLRPDMVLSNKQQDPNTWPVFGVLARETRELGGHAVHAHGGYAQEIWADAVLGATDGVELLQFGLYRGIGLEGWYHLLNLGLQFPAVGASDYPACRKLCDCVTYVRASTPPSAADWVRAMATGKSLVTTGPLLVLEVDGHGPGDRLVFDVPRSVRIRVRVQSPAARVTNLALVVGGRTLAEQSVDPQGAHLGWAELAADIPLEHSTWIAARAWSTAPSGAPDAEAHTNPVYCYLQGRAPFEAASARFVEEKILEVRGAVEKRPFANQQAALEYFDAALARLRTLLEESGASAPTQADTP